MTPLNFSPPSERAQEIAREELARRIASDERMREHAQGMEEYRGKDWLRRWHLDTFGEEFS